MFNIVCTNLLVAYKVILFMNKLILQTIYSYFCTYEQRRIGSVGYWRDERREGVGGRGWRGGRREFTNTLTNKSAVRSRRDSGVSHQNNVRNATNICKSTTNVW